MRATLGGSLESALTYLPPVIINPHWRSMIRKMAYKLPPVVSTLLECRLSAEQAQVDLSQSFLAGDQAILINFLESTQFRDKSWNNVRSLVGQWSNKGSPVEKYLEGLWLELDLLSESEEDYLPVPAIFFSLDTSDFNGCSDQKLEDVLDYFFRMMQGSDQYQTYVTAYLNSLKFLPENVCPNYFGMMLSRSPVTVRAQYSGFQHDQIKFYLEKIGVRSFPESYQKALKLAFSFFESIVLCIDLSPEIQPRIGLELFADQIRTDSSIGVFLNNLITLGYCSQPKCDAIMAWPGCIDPVSSEADWPDYLIIQSLQKSTDCFSVMNRRINHFKLVCQPEHEIEAKVYLAFDHWVKLGKC